MSSAVSNTEATEEIMLEASTSGLSRMNVWFDELAQRRGLAKSLVHDIKLCLNEGVTNVVFHGLAGHEEATIHVALDFAPDGTVAVIRDTGIAFNPLDIPAFVPADDIASAAIGGLGIKLMLETSDRMEYRRDGDTNELALHFPPATPR